ncbi:MAG TPA: YiiX/YebB-like N1pC/P60 family cysteine hydrolase [Bacteroidia bacterium]|nr:YiiX/YebB-like N1pC/P60 family cysteine hydrolase [Bacteroidia bacterium]
MKSFWFTFIALVVFCLFMQFENNLSGSSKRNNYTGEFLIPGTIKNNIQSGDIILRNGKGFISDVFRQFSLKDKSYSHAGIISVEQDKIFVYHIIGGENRMAEVRGQKPEDEIMNGELLRKELLEAFCNSKENNAYAIYRYDLSKKAKENIITNLHSMYGKKIVFDSHFDLATDTALYCSELVYKAVTAAAADKNYIPLTIINGNKYIAPDNLYLNPHAALIYSYTY